MFRHHVLALHPPRFTNVDLIRPTAIVDELVFGQAPFGNFRANIGWHTRIVGHEVHQALLILRVFLQYFTSTTVAGLWIVVVAADVIRAERTVIVRIRL